jgi:uncharacterized membrane protein
VAFVALAALALGLRSSYLTVRGLWFDEAWSVRLARLPLSRMVEELRAVDSHPPLYALALWTWVKAFGDSEAVVRLLSVLAGTGTVVLTYVAARRWRDQLVAVMAAFWVAVSPFHIMASQEARMYSLLGLLVLASSAALWEALQGTGKWWVIYGVFGSASLYTHYLAAPMVLAQGLYVMVIDRSRNNAIRWATTAAGMGVVFTPWLPSFLHQLRSGHGWPQWRPPLTVRTPLDLLALLEFGGDFFGTGSYHWSGTVALGWYAPLLLPMVLLVIIGLTWPALPRSFRLFLATLVVIPVVVPLGVSVYRNVVYPRYFSFLVPLVAMALACGVVRVGTAFRHRRLITAIVVALLLSYQLPVLVDYYVSPRFRVYDWRSAAALVAQRGRPDDLVLLVPGDARVPFDYYYHGPLRRVGLTPVEYWGRPELAEAEGDAARLTAHHVAEIAKHYRRLWLVLTPPEPPGARRRLAELVGQFYVPVVGYDFVGVHVFLWERRPVSESPLRVTR